MEGTPPISIRLDKRIHAEGGDRLHSLPSGRESVPGSPSPAAHHHHSQETTASFGSAVHLGEQLSALLTIRNEAAFELDELRVKVELQTSTQRILLQDDPVEGASNGRLLPADQLQLALQHEIREVGLHIVVCSVHYTGIPTGERKFVRKFFKFPVSNPLSLKTKVSEHRAEDRLYLEAQVQNVSNTSFFLHSVRFEPLAPLHAQCLEPVAGDNVNILADQLAGDLAFSPHVDNGEEHSQESHGQPDHQSPLQHPAEYRAQMLPAARTTQFAFVIESRQSIIPLDQPLPLGRLDIRWRTGEGDFGRLQTGVLTHAPVTPSLPPITTTLLGLPSEGARLRQPLDVLLLCRNVTSQDLSDVSLIFDLPNDSLLAHTPVVLLGNSEVSLGNLTALNSTRLQVVLYPLQAGLVESDRFWIAYADAQGQSHRVPLRFHLQVV